MLTCVHIFQNMVKERFELQHTNSICASPEEQFFEAVKYNDTEKIRTLFKENGSALLKANRSCTDTCNVLQIVCRDWSNNVTLHTIKTLIDLGVDLYYCNDENNRQETLHFAALSYNREILETICEHIKRTNKEKLNSVTSNGRTALLLLAADKTNYDHPNFLRCVQILIDHGININKADSNNYSPILLAAKNGFKTLVNILLNQPNIDINNHKFRGKSAKDYIEQGNLYDGNLPETSSNNNLDPTTCLFQLMSKGDVQEFIKKIQSTGDVDADDGNVTLLQFACKIGLIEAVEKLLELGADPNKISKNSKTPIEIAAIEGYYEIFDLLINHQAVNVPENLLNDLLIYIDEIEREKKSHKKCFDLLLNSSEKIDVNYSDDRHHYTPLHYSVLYGNSKTTLELLKRGALLSNKNSFGVLPVDDMEADVLEEHLNNCIEYYPDGVNSKAIFHYESLVPNFEQPQFDEESIKVCGNPFQEFAAETEVLARMGHNSELRPLLKHPVVTSFLYLKWHKLRWFFYANFQFYILFCLALYLHILVNYNVENPEKSVALLVFLHVTFWLLVLRETFQMFVSPKTYFFDLENYIEISLIAFVFVMLFQGSPQDNTRKQISAVVILLSAFELVMLIGQSPMMSAKIVMLRTVSWNFFKCLLWFAVLILAFAFSFYILFNDNSNNQKRNSTKTDDDEEQDFFMDPGVSAFKTFVMLTGEFDASSIKFETFPYTSRIIFIMFVFIIAIVLYNLINGLAVSDIQLIKNEAELHYYVTRIQQINYIEKMLLGSFKPTYIQVALKRFCCCLPLMSSMRNVSWQLLAKKTLLYPRYHYETNLNGQKTFLQNCCGIYLGNEIIKKTRKVLEKNKLSKKAAAEQEKIATEQTRLKVAIFEILKKFDDLTTQ